VVAVFADELSAEVGKGAEGQRQEQQAVDEQPDRVRQAHRGDVTSAAQWGVDGEVHHFGDGEGRRAGEGDARVGDQPGQRCAEGDREQRYPAANSVLHQIPDGERKPREECSGGEFASPRGRPPARG
jgi:hypothetical protein